MVGFRVFGEIEGVGVGALFVNRKALSIAGVHRPTIAGISGSEAEGADSIVLSGGYEDDVDLGDTIVYTGHGGNDPASKKQVADQALAQGNRALAVSCAQGLPVRVVRGYRLDSDLAPKSGYRYDGLYRVERFWSETGRSSYKIWRFLLARCDIAPSPWYRSEAGTGAAGEPSEPLRRVGLTQRIVRNTAVVQRVKHLHNCTCQICSLRLLTMAGPYAEGAHIRPLGAGHNGPDSEDNVLCLCANCHVLFDFGRFTVSDDLTLFDLLDGESSGQLRTVPAHRISLVHLAYHRSLFSALSS
ncbi:MAG: HNH endonuclease [Gemmatimonadaceae bacterium]|nr:HNH endonuclease [Gloeobacterales cyanobacterium ES-bin-141]